MPGLVPGIHVLAAGKKGVDGRVKPGYDDPGACGTLEFAPVAWSQRL